MAQAKVKKSPMRFASSEKQENIKKLPGTSKGDLCYTY